MPNITLPDGSERPYDRGVSGADIAAGLESGQAEFGAVNGGTGVAPQRASGLLTKLVAPYNNDATNAKYVDWISIIGRADRGLTADPSSIIGKKVGVTGGGTPRAYLGEWLRINGLSEDQFEIVTMGAPDMLTAIVNGDVDDMCHRTGAYLKSTIPDSAHWMLPGTGHALNLEEPELVNQGLERFFTEAEARSPA